MCPRKNPPRESVLRSSDAPSKNLLSYCFEAKKIGHAVTPGWPRRQPKRSRQRAAREDRPVGRPVRETQLLAGTGEQHGVLANEVAGPQAREADFPLGTGSGAANRRRRDRLRERAAAG